MKIITSALGDVWLTEENTARPENGDREFGLNQNMQEMLEKATTSQRWANRLRTIATAELSDDNKYILIPDKEYYGWLRSISLTDPDFRRDDWSGFRLTYPEDKRLHVSQDVEEPGAHYGPYHIIGPGPDGKYGEVGFSEDLSEIPGILERLKNKDLNPLPKHFATHSLMYDLAGGYKAETYALENRGMDIWTVSFPTFITNPQGQLVYAGELDPADLMKLREPDADIGNVVTNDLFHTYSNEYIEVLNDHLSVSRNAKEYTPQSLDDLKETLEKLQPGAGLKFLCPAGNTEVVISWEQRKAWRGITDHSLISSERFPSDFYMDRITDSSVLLCTERAYTIRSKFVNGLGVEFDEVPGMNLDKLFEFSTSDKSFKSTIDNIESELNADCQMSILETKSTLDLIRDYSAKPEILSEVSYTIEKMEKMRQKSMGIEHAPS